MRGQKAYRCLVVNSLPQTLDAVINILPSCHEAVVATPGDSCNHVKGIYGRVSPVDVPNITGAKMTDSTEAICPSRISCVGLQIPLLVGSKTF